jgi:hypothetical protein
MGAREVGRIRPAAATLVEFSMKFLLFINNDLIGVGLKMNAESTKNTLGEQESFGEIVSKGIEDFYWLFNNQVICVQ